MASLVHTFTNVLLARLTEDGQITVQHQIPITLTIIKCGNGAQISIDQQGSSPIEVTSSSERARVGRQGLLITMENENQSTLIKFPSEIECRKASQILKDFTQNLAKSIFTERTDKDSATQYFQFYSYLSQQQNMMQDYIRTSTYQQAMLSNTADFAGKVVLDVGAGSGLLSFFAAQAGARKVYAVEASNMAPFCQKLVNSNGLADIITVISAKIEETELPELVDTIISEPIGYMLFNERMIETYLHAKKFLKPGGKMFPTEGHLFIAPFHDEALFQEQSLKSNFWCQQQFHGIDLTTLRMDSHAETFKQPIVDTFAITTCVATANKFPVDFLQCEEQDLYVIDVPLQFTMNSTGHIHGLAFWFDLAFIGSSETIWLSTAPTEPLTHWYQVRCLLVESVFAKQGQIVTGRLTMRANSRQSYDVEISIKFPCSNRVSTNVLDLKNPYFRYGAQVQVQPPQNSAVSPTEQYYENQGYPAQAVNGTDLGSIMNQPQNMTLLAQQVNATSISQSPPINPGSIPALGNGAFGVPASQHRTSVGGGVAPSQVSQQVVSQQFGLSNQFMIGDYAATNLVNQKPN